MSYAGSEHDRRLGGVLTIGRVKALDAAKGLVQVDMDGPDTDWIPWLTQRAGGDRTYWCPEVGEQVLVAAPSGELGNGVVIGCIFQDAHPEPGDSPDIHRTVYKDGTVVEYDRAAHQLKIDVSSSSGSVLVICKTATVRAAESVTIDTPETTCTGSLTVGESLAVNGPSLTHNGKNVGSTHTHGGVESGGSSTAAPN